MSKPPILTEEQMFRAAKGAYALVPDNKEVWKADVTGRSIARRVAEAQQAADIAWLREEVEKKLLNPHQVFLAQHPHLDNQILRGQIEGYEDCRQGLLALLRGTQETP